jgi:hypothetical protein
MWYGNKEEFESEKQASQQNKSFQKGRKKESERQEVETNECWTWFRPRLLVGSSAYRLHPTEENELPFVVLFESLFRRFALSVKLRNANLSSICVEPFG